MNKAVFLDRDGVVNKIILKDGEPHSPRSLSEFEFTENIEEELRRLKKAGYIVIIVSNQPDIARGKMDVSELDKMNDMIQANLPVDDILICPHDDVDDCSCRKPRPGMILHALKKYNIDANQSFFMGDGWKDMEAAKNAGCKGILIDARYNQDVNCFKRAKHIQEAVSTILNKKEEF